ncbi:MAG: flavodoxin family protein [Ghiorsea sp.]
MDVLITYHSDYEHTQQVADAIAAGAKAVLSQESISANVVVKQAEDTNLDDMRFADVLIFGSPVHMGSMAWQMKKLIDSGSKFWMEGALEGKVGGVFATYGGYGGAGGGVEQTLIGLHANFLEQGMLVCGFPRSLTGYADAGIHWGLAVRTGNDEGMPEGISDASMVAARAYGSHVLETALRLQD